MLQSMNKSSAKLATLLNNLESMIESNETVKTGNQEILLQLSLVKEQHILLQDHVGKINASMAITDQKLRDDLQLHKSLKLEIAQFFGKSHLFFDNMNQPGDGHAKVFEFVKHIHKQSENSKMSHIKTHAAKQPTQPIPTSQPVASKQVRNRSDPRFNDPKYDNDQYLAEIERNMLKSLGITPEEIGFANIPGTSDNMQEKQFQMHKPGKSGGEGQVKQVREPASQKQSGTKLSRKYSDNKYDKPEYEARIEQQTLKALESMGINTQGIDDSKQKQDFKIEANHLKKRGNERRSGSNSGTRQPAKEIGMQKSPLDMLAAMTELQPAKEKKKKNVFGLDFDIPDELSELIAKEMKSQTETGGKPNNPL